MPKQTDLRQTFSPFKQPQALDFTQSYCIALSYAAEKKQL